MVAVAVPVARSTPLTSETLVIVGITLILVPPLLASASGIPLVIKSKAIAVLTEMILFLTVIIFSPLFIPFAEELRIEVPVTETLLVLFSVRAKNFPEARFKTILISDCADRLGKQKSDSDDGS